MASQWMTSLSTNFSTNETIASPWKNFKAKMYKYTQLPGKQATTQLNLKTKKQFLARHVDHKIQQMP